MFSSHNEAAMLMDAIESLRILREKSRTKSNSSEEYHPRDNSDVEINIKDIKEGKCDALEHRRKIRELTIAIEEQLAVVSSKDSAPVEIPEKQYAQKHEFSGLTLTESQISAQINVLLQSTESEIQDEHQRKIDNLTRDSDVKMNVAMQAHVLHRKTNQTSVPLSTQAEKMFYATGESIAPFSGRLAETESTQPKSAVSRDLVHVKTLSTELDTLDADSMQREQALPSSHRNVISSLDNKEDFESEATPFGAPLSPESFFVKYGIHASQPYRSTLCTSQCVIEGAEELSPLRHKSKQERQKAVIKNAAILSESTKDAMRAAEASKPNGPIEIFKKMIVWDVSSSSSQEESIPGGRIYNDTFDDSSCHDEERSDLGSTYSSSFETDAENVKDKRMGKKQSMPQYSSSFDSDDSDVHQTTYSGTADEKTEGGTSGIEYQSSYTSTDGYDTISYVSSSTTLLGKEGFPLL
ncbi:hypothetical protein HJC23_002533 [Cyclotella cryptica]|uniref:Uncharacterized protein n=1 Tax=Cyclotella cryptica TaxID=29204 RepID=A0ABD3QX26_9STRA|eukprot:CCRYP_001382-RA/>CCRYP_001382-RA protein AED:0.02 eAED:0.02 QI:134/1/1/1/1/1/2/64/466